MKYFCLFFKHPDNNTFFIHFIDLDQTTIKVDAKLSVDSNVLGVQKDASVVVEKYVQNKPEQTWIKGPTDQGSRDLSWRVLRR